MDPDKYFTHKSAMTLYKFRDLDYCHYTSFTQVHPKDKVWSRIDQRKINYVPDK